MKKVKAVVFDAYGTIVKIGKKTKPLNPYKMISGNIKNHGYNPVTMELSLKDYDEIMQGSSAYIDNYIEAEIALQKEIKSIKPFPEAMDVMKILKKHGIKIAVCSNLAQPYAQPIIDIFGDVVDEYVWSFNTFAKPDIRIYQIVEERLGLLGNDIHMIGDSYINDYMTPKEFMGWSATFLDRTGGDAGHPSVSRLNSIFLDIQL
jgi:HAD superfamily hydrolase (TIGR01549 family)